MSARRLVVWRHGRTQWNLEGRFQGQSDIPLDDVGSRQAEVAAARLVERYSPTAIVSSDLQRAARTAAALAELTGLTVTYDPDLREIDVGSWAGLLVEEVQRTYASKLEPEERAEDEGSLRYRLEADPDFRRGGDGETLAEVAERAEKALRRAIDLVPDGETVVAASHGLAGRIGVARFLGLPHQHWSIFAGLRNCGWITLQMGSHGWRVTEWNAAAT